MEAHSASSLSLSLLVSSFDSHLLAVDGSRGSVGLLFLQAVEETPRTGAGGEENV